MTSIYNPKVYKELSTTHRVLVREWVAMDGVQLSAVEPFELVTVIPDAQEAFFLRSCYKSGSFMPVHIAKSIYVFHHFVIDHSNGDNIFLRSH